MIMIDRTILDSADGEGGLFQTCRQYVPYECCGILTGKPQGGHTRITGFRVMHNAAAHPEIEFSFEPMQWVEILYKETCRSDGNGIVGIFHSHPAAPAIPSPTDMSLLWDFPVYAIISLTNNKTPAIRCYRPTIGLPWEELDVICVP
ncbi:MAG: family peptidase [Paenibacillaceae bacterium]|nr:family peptidase [Paenibacillaceae bacterium]